MADDVSISGVEEALARFRRLQSEGDHAAALNGARALLVDYPENRDLLLVVASAARFLGQISDSLATLDRLETLQARWSLLHQERGLCRIAQRDAQGAIAALLTAVQINPALPLSWRMLDGVYRLVGDTASAAKASAQLQALKALPAEVVRATALFSDGEVNAAESVIRRFLLTHGHHPEAMRLLARIGLAQDVLDDAEALLEGALLLAPNHRGARLDYAQTLLKRHRYVRAREEARALLELEPENLDYLSVAATAAVGLGETDGAIGLYEAMLAKLTPGTPLEADIRLWLGHALKTVGRTPEAIAAYRAAAQVRPDFGDAYWSLANLKRYVFSDEEIAAMTAAEASDGLSPEDRWHLCFALGKAFEDRGEAAHAWAWYSRGNGLKRADSRYRPEIFETNTAEQTRICSPAFFAARQGWGVHDLDPIFIVGLPRSGSTLIEQILASHSQVEGTQELAEIPAIALELQGRDADLDHPRYPAVLADMDAAAFAALGARYLAETRAYRHGAPRFIDKMPNNFRHIGLIHLMLPKATIIDARREPMACCFSNLKQLFANGQEFTYSVEDIARYYRTYLDIMDHWDRALPGRILTVRHEAVVDDLEGSVRRILDHCRLAFEPGCVEFHKTARSVRTPSSEQVRQPIFRDGLDQWRNFSPWLNPLKTALGDAMTRYGFESEGPRS
jgi:tetratricopeptide (TPR) repeat protein